MTKPQPPDSFRNRGASRPARDRLIDAAAEVFARDGIAGSTTREIAHAAGVNEVTLFRIFLTKQNLLTAVLERVFAPSTVARIKPPAVETDLSGIVREYVVGYSVNLRRNLALRRVLIGEIQHFQAHELMAIRGIFEPTRQQLIKRLRGAQEAGIARKEMDPAIVADQINALIFMGTLKTALPLPRGYSAQSYVDACVQTIVRANEISKAEVPPQPSKRRKS